MKVYLVASPSEVFDEHDSNSAAIYGVFSTRGLAQAEADREKIMDKSVYELELDVVMYEPL